LGQRIGRVAACESLAVPRSSLYRARQPQPPVKPRPTPARALSPEERRAVREGLNSERFQDSVPRQVYATLLDDEGVYLCHWRTLYRILEEHEEVRERRNPLQHPPADKPVLVATAPNQVWTWDITQLLGPAKGLYFYLYVIIDLFSRYVTGWLLADREAAELAETLMKETCAKHGIQPHPLTWQADRGAPMRAKTMAQLLVDLEVSKSHTRPYTPDDNPYSEAQFKTMKYRPDFPDRFESQAAAHAWARSFFEWYNHHHRHTGLALMTPAMVHYGLVDQIQAQRQQVLQAAYAAYPERFVRGQPALPELPKAVWINPPESDTSTPEESQRLLSKFLSELSHNA
jgi:putative transposase